MSSKSRGNLEEIILAGIGTMATTVEKSRKIFDGLVKKGDLTVEQGKSLNEELRHTVKTAICETGTPAPELVVSRIIQKLDKLTPDERVQIQFKLQELEKAEEKKKEPSYS